MCGHGAAVRGYGARVCVCAQEAMNRRLEDKQNDIRRMAGEVLNSKAAARDAEKLREECAALKANEGALQDLVTAGVRLFDVLPEREPVASAGDSTLALLAVRRAADWFRARVRD